MVLQATGEAIGAGVSAASGIELLAIYEGYQSSRHFIEGCEEYSEGIRCQLEADGLEKQYEENDGQNEEDEPEKKWWKFWK